MVVYLLWFDNGQMCDDHDITLLGGYTTEEKRRKAQELISYYDHLETGAHYTHTQIELDVVSQKISV